MPLSVPLSVPVPVPSLSLAQAGCDILVFLTPEFWDYRCLLPCLTLIYFVLIFRFCNIVLF